MRALITTYLLRVIYVVKIEWMIADVTFDGSPDRAERGILGTILDVFWPLQLAFVVRKPL